MVTRREKWGGLRGKVGVGLPSLSRFAAKHRIRQQIHPAIRQWTKDNRGYGDWQKGVERTHAFAHPVLMLDSSFGMLVRDGAGQASCPTVGTHTFTYTSVRGGHAYVHIPALMSVRTDANRNGCEPERYRMTSLLVLEPPTGGA